MKVVRTFVAPWDGCLYYAGETIPGDVSAKILRDLEGSGLIEQEKQPEKAGSKAEQKPVAAKKKRG